MSHYITYIEATALADDRLDTDAWDDAVTADGSIAGEAGSQTYKSVAMATKIIDRLNFLGSKLDADQANQFPRDDDTDVPDDIKEACFEIALALLDGVDPQIEAENLGMISQGYANVRSTYDRGVGAEYIAAGIPSSTAWRYLLPYLRSPHFVDVLRTS